MCSLKLIPCNIDTEVSQRPAGAVGYIKVFWAKPSLVVQRTALPA